MEHNAQTNDPITPAQRIRADWRALAARLSYRTMAGNVPYFAFVALLCVIYIANGHRAVEMQRQLNNANDTLKELRWKYTDIQTKLMNAGTETDILRRGATIGLQPLTLPAYSIVNDSGGVKN